MNFSHLLRRYVHRRWQSLLTLASRYSDYLYISISHPCSDTPVPFCQRHVAVMVLDTITGGLSVWLENDKNSRDEKNMDESYSGKTLLFQISF